MQYLMSRYGGSLLIIGKGKASDERLPKDQSLDNMLDNYATEIIPIIFTFHLMMQNRNGWVEWINCTFLKQ